MSGPAYTWLITAEFKDSFSPALLSASCENAHAPATVEFFRCPGRRAARRFRRALAVAAALQARGIALRRPVALGLRKKYMLLHEACLALETLPGAIPLKSYIDLNGLSPAGLKLPPGRNLFDLFAGFSARLRAVCLLPSDFNLEDVLIKINPDQGFELCLADPGRLELKPVAGRKPADTLVLLDAMLWGKGPSRLQLALFQQYSGLVARWCRTFFQCQADMVRELRIFSSCGGQQAERIFRTGSLRGCLLAGPYESAVLSLLENPDSLFNRPDARVLKNSPTTTALLLKVPQLPWPVYVKRYNKKGRLFGLKYLVRRSRAERAWSLARKLRDTDIPTPDVLGFADRRRFGALDAAWLITRGLARAEALDAFIEKNFEHWDRRKKNLFIEQVSAMLRAAHAQGLLHGDLKAKNILIEKDGDQEKLWLIDLDSARLRSKASPGECWRDIARLNCSFPDTGLITRTQRLRFLKASVQKQQSLRQAWQTILALSVRKLQKSGRSFS